MVSFPLRCKTYIGMLIVDVIEEKVCIPFRVEKAKMYRLRRDDRIRPLNPRIDPTICMYSHGDP